MRRVVLKMHVSLDGYVGPLDEEAEWVMRHVDDELGQWEIDEILWSAGTHVIGRATYEEMAARWPNSDSPLAAPMNEIPKLVFSNTLRSPDWPEKSLESGDPAQEIARLREDAGKDILARGGSKLVTALPAFSPIPA